jgi:hypothetical protein
MRAGRYPDAMEILRYGIELNPSTAIMYERLAAAYNVLGDYKAEAITFEEELAVAGPTPAAMTGLQHIYSMVGCAFRNADGGGGLNPNCPPVHNDMCAAWANVVKHYEAARLDLGARNIREVAQRNGCGILTN